MLSREISKLVNCMLYKFIKQKQPESILIETNYKTFQDTLHDNNSERSYSDR